MKIHAETSGVGANDEGVQCIGKDVSMRFTTQNGLPNNSIRAIVEDKSGNIWIGTGTKGLLKLSPGKFRTVHLSSAVNAIAEDKDGFIWLGCDDGLLCLENENPVTNELTEFCQGLRIRHVGLAQNGIVGDKTRVAVETLNNNLYIGTTTGLSVVKNDGSIKSYHRLQGFETEFIMCVYEDDEGLVWVGTDGGGIYIINHDAPDILSGLAH